MNKILKAKIIEKFGSQTDFAIAIKEDESLVSRVIRGRRDIEPEKQIKWAKALQCEPIHIFKEK